MWSGIWSAAATTIGLWTWIWSPKDCGLGQEVACLFQWWKNSTGLMLLVVLMWKGMSLSLRKNHLLRGWGWLSLLNWIGVLTFSLFLKLPPRKLQPWLDLWSFFCLKLLCISMNLPTPMYRILLSHLYWRF